VSSHDAYLTFTVAGRRCAVAGSRVIEVLRLEEAAGFSLFDLARFFGAEASRTAPRQCVIVVTAGERVMGLVADEATDVISLSAADFVSVPSFGPRITIPYLSALARTGDVLSLVLDMDQLLTAAHIEAFSTGEVPA